ncbi:hypothetical protein PpBr36_07529 [Pyricularia pennisetigena]|uniref:hypothetical protein n=1 Tax=Pyricularia pennisetigena TaxID=1578925 RepID=UPI0011518A18|nr:hypothetical protein PpBr36_07529 [Pyricularia pennisetigena]TLS25895.1 hypothetical protein PpBr36_07529 [Pyricularia pennisetigena]
MSIISVQPNLGKGGPGQVPAMKRRDRLRRPAPSQVIHSGVIYHHLHGAYSACGILAWYAVVWRHLGARAPYPITSQGLDPSWR